LGRELSPKGYVESAQPKCKLTF